MKAHNERPHLKVHKIPFVPISLSNYYWIIQQNRATCIIFILVVNEHNTFRCIILYRITLMIKDLPGQIYYCTENLTLDKLIETL